MNKKLYTLVLLSFFMFNITIAQTVTLSGNVLRHNGEPVEGITVNCTNATAVISDGEGKFTFSDLPEGENYTISGNFETDFFEEITILDVLYSADLILAIIEDSEGFQVLAGDLNNTNALTTFDLVLMRRAALKINANFPNIYWNFFNGNANFGIPPNITLINVTEDMTDLELVAVKSGDVAIDEDHIPAPSEAPVPEYFIEDVSVSQNEEFSLEIKVGDFSQIAGFQQGLAWNPAFLEFVEFENSDDADFLVNESFAIDGEVLIAGAKVSGGGSTFNLDDGSVLYTMKFKALQDLNSMEGVIDFSSTLIPSQTVYRANDNRLYLVENIFNGATISVGDFIGLENFDLAPNPAHNETFINISFDQKENAELSLYDYSGKLIKSWSFEGHSFVEPVYLHGLPVGTYLLKLRTDKGFKTKKLIKY